MVDQEASETEHTLGSGTSEFTFIDATSQPPLHTQERSTSTDSAGFFEPPHDQIPVYEADIPSDSSIQYTPQLSQPYHYQDPYHIIHQEPTQIVGETQNHSTPERASTGRTLSGSSDHGSSTAEGLSEALGTLRIDETGIGMFACP